MQSAPSNGILFSFFFSFVTTPCLSDSEYAISIAMSDCFLCRTVSKTIWFWQVFAGNLIYFPVLSKKANVCYHTLTHQQSYKTKIEDLTVCQIFYFLFFHLCSDCENKYLTEIPCFYRSIFRNFLKQRFPFFFTQYAVLTLYNINHGRRLHRIRRSSDPAHRKCWSPHRHRGARNEPFYQELFRPGLWFPRSHSKIH